jgi:hypothetical protein
MVNNEKFLKLDLEQKIIWLTCPKA